MKKNVILPTCPVVFEPEHHTYTLDGKELSGVTAIVKWLFPDTYAGIPEDVLMRAAEYGTLIHGKCELADSMGIADEPIVKEYQRIIKDAGLEVLCSEYLVSDCKDIASSIDKVFTDDSLGDIKTTSQVHEANVQLQLSIYAYLYELQTGRKANKLYLIWLPKPQYGKPMVKELQRIPDLVCKYIIEVFAANGDTLSALSAVSHYLPAQTIHKRTKGEIPDELSSIVEELMMVKQQLNKLSERESELKKTILTVMQRNSEDTWGNDLIQFTRKAAYQRESIDTKALKANEPSIYESYKKVTTVAESLTYKLL